MMTNSSNKINMTGIVHIGAALLVVASFFMPWLVWDGAAVKGSDMPTGAFFKIAEEKSGIANPFSGLSFAFSVFWLVPAFAAVAVALILVKKNSLWPALIAGALSTSLVIVYYMFTKNIVGNGLIKAHSVKPWMIIQFVSALVLMLTAGMNKWPLKAGLILATVAGTWLGFTLISKKLEKDLLSEGHATTASVKTDFSVSSDALIKEFMASDTTANNKYREKMLEVSGMVNSIDIAADSTSTIKFADSTGSYAIFSVEKAELEKAKAVKAGDSITVKGICSGSIFSEILGTTSINFKRSVIHKK
jgi:hypothetical protein